MSVAISMLQASNHPPASYEAAKPVEPPPGDVFSDEQLVKYFLYYGKTENLGRIANLWLDWAVNGGASSDECIRLAGLYSIAVDFQKSGVPAVLPKELEIKGSRAHWRELKNKDVYHDDGVIGILYDEVTISLKNDRKNHAALVNRKRDRYGQIECFAEDLKEELKNIYRHALPEKLGFGSAGCEDMDAEMLRFAKDQRDDYDDELFVIMNKYKLHSEGEILTGLMRKYHRLNKRRRHDVSEEVRRSCRELRRNFRQSFFLHLWDLVTGDGEEHVDKQQFSPSSEDDTKDDEIEELVKRLATISTEKSSSRPRDQNKQAIQTYACRLAAAYYMATYSPLMRQFQSSSSRDDQALFSFPWIVADVIACGMNSTT